jgi:hypothetical protein
MSNQVTYYASRKPPTPEKIGYTAAVRDLDKWKQRPDVVHHRVSEVVAGSLQDEAHAFDAARTCALRYVQLVVSGAGVNSDLPPIYVLYPNGRVMRMYFRFDVDHTRPPELVADGSVTKTEEVADA